MQRVTKRLQRVTRGHRGSQEVTEGYKRLQGVTRCYRGIKRVIGGYTK